MTTVDPAVQTATAMVDHFSDFQFGDGSSPSSAFLPSLQGFQVSSFTGAASYSYPIDVPAGPGGLKPSLSLSYSSGATDGDGGKRLKQQADTVKATESVQRAQATVAGRYAGSQTRVQSALDSLERIKQKQAERGARMESAAELARDSSEDALDAKLRAAGITPQAGNAQSVLERLKAQRAAAGGKSA